VPQPPQRGASESKRLLCKCCRFSRSVVDDPIPGFSSIGASTSAVAPSRRSRRQHRSPELIVGPNQNLPTNNFAKTKMTTSPAAAAPTRRLEQVGRPQSSRESARLARARDGSESVERWIPSTMLFELIAVALNPLPRAGRRHPHHRRAPRARA
jgi:hypothetical protein